MATVYRQNKERTKRQYISTAAFNTNFYTYNLTTNPTTFVTTGSLDPVTGATSVNCPAGRILRETGRRLFPGAHPQITTLMVMVFDTESQLKGFIDPNASVFAVFNSDKPCELVDGTDTTLGVHRGPSVYTFGNVTAVGSVISGGPVYSSTQTDVTFTNSVATNGNQILIDTTKGNTFSCTYSPGSSTALTGAININTTVVPPAGVTVTLFFYTGANVTNAGTYKFTGTAVWSDVATTIASSVGSATAITTTNIAASKTYVLTFISNGANLTLTTFNVF
jgi:hypothetical protein